MYTQTATCEQSRRVVSGGLLLNQDIRSCGVQSSFIMFHKPEKQRNDTVMICDGLLGRTLVQQEGCEGSFDDLNPRKTPFFGSQGT